MLGFFKNKKKNRSIYDEIKEVISYSEICKLIEKANNLRKLGRDEEAVDIFSKAENIALSAVQKSPNSFKANLLLAFFYKEAQISERFEEIIIKLLDSGNFEIDENKRITLKAELYKIQRENPSKGGGNRNQSNNFTTIYSCQNCGRIVNFVTMPCPHCEWYPSDLLSFARSVALSNSVIKVPAMLLLSREISKGRSPLEVVINLEDNAKKLYEMPESASKLRYMFNLLQENKNKTYRHMEVLRECPNCGDRILSSRGDQCDSCDEPIDFPDSLRFLICLDNILYLLEQRVEISNSNEFSEFVCLIVSMSNDMLRNQEAPSFEKRRYAISILREMKAIADANRGAVIDITNPEQLKIYLVKESMLEDSEQFGLFLYSEIEFFVAKLLDGIKL